MPQQERGALGVGVIAKVERRERECLDSVGQLALLWRVCLVAQRIVVAIVVIPGQPRRFTAVWKRGALWTCRCKTTPSLVLSHEDL